MITYTVRAFNINTYQWDLISDNETYLQAIGQYKKFRKKNEQICYTVNEEKVIDNIHYLIQVKNRTDHFISIPAGKGVLNTDTYIIVY